MNCRLLHRLTDLAAEPGLVVVAASSAGLVPVGAAEPGLGVVGGDHVARLGRRPLVGHPVVKQIYIYIWRYCSTKSLHKAEQPSRLDGQDVVGPGADLVAPALDRPVPDGLPIAGGAGVVPVHPLLPGAHCSRTRMSGSNLLGLGTKFGSDS